jgi:chloramphenicol O-acetyltransferase type A
MKTAPGLRVPEFRYRIRNDDLIEFDTVHPLSTIMEKDDVFSFCTMEYHEDFGNSWISRVRFLVGELTLYFNTPGL